MTTLLNIEIKITGKIGRRAVDVPVTLADGQSAVIRVSRGKARIYSVNGKRLKAKDLLSLTATNVNGKA